jgi:glycolate oxidase FAD binding subunit
MSMAAEDICSQLAGIVGPTHAIFDPAQLTNYQIDGQIPSAIVRPGSSEEVAEVVKFAGSEKLAVVPAGARTKLAIGMPPRRYDFALDMTRLDRIIAYDPGDLTLGVEPGLPLTRLASALAGHRQFLPLAVPFMDRATVGGTIASGVDSPLRQLYGTARDFVLGVQFVTGDGTQVKSGGSVVKNVTGYDIHKLMIGALGTLGIITRINFRTFPLPAMVRTYLATFRWANGACEFRHAIARSPLRPQSLEIFAARDAGAPRSGEDTGKIFSRDRWSVGVSVAGRAEVLDRSRRELERLAREADGDSFESFAELSEAQQESIASYLREFPALAADKLRATSIFKISALPNNLAALTEGIASETRKRDLSWAVMMRGVGVTYLALFAQDMTTASLRRLKDGCQSVFRCCNDRQWGRGVLLACPAEFKREINVWGQPPADFPLMQGFKKVFDPGDVLTPGRFIGGL